MGNAVNKNNNIANGELNIKNINKSDKKLNILILGLNGSGKTTLLYHNFIPEWKNITSYMQPTISYHYEEMKWNDKIIGFWDISGNPIMRDIWKLIYRNIKVNSVLYTINIMDISDEAITENIMLLSLLLNDECLQASCVVLVFNTFSDVNYIDENFKNEILIKYKIKEFYNNYENRIHYIFVDCKNCHLSKKWMDIIHLISQF